MELNEQRWYVRWFFWSLGIVDEFVEGYYKSQFTERTNLCHFMRTILVYAPLILFLHAAVLGAAIAALTLVPIYLFGGLRYAWGIGAVVAVALLVLGIKALLEYRRRREEQQWQARRERLYEPPVVAAETEVQRGPGFLKVVWQWFVA